MTELGQSNFHAALAMVLYPNGHRGRRHPLTAILALAVCAMISSARSPYAIHIGVVSRTPLRQRTWTLPAPGLRPSAVSMSYFGGWTSPPSSPRWTNGAGRDWGRRDHHCGGPRNPARDSRLGVARRASDGWLYSRLRLGGGAKGGRVRAGGTSSTMCRGRPQSLTV